MKKNFFRSTVLALFAMFSTAVMAQDVTVSITDVTIEAGNTATATMSFTGEGVKGFGFYVNAIAENKITFEGCEAIEDAFAGTASAKAGKFNEKKQRTTISVKDDDGEIMIPGDFLTLTFKAADDVAEGEYEATIADVRPSLSDGTEAKLGDINFKVTVGATGIEAIKLIENNAPVYNLNGMLMNGNLQKGVYVQNGKKFIVK